MRTVFWVLVLAACGTSEEAFPEAHAEAECAYLVDCYSGAYASFEECLGDRRQEPPVGCVYQSSAARSCLNDLDALACPLDGAAPVMPEACAAVWTGCE